MATEQKVQNVVGTSRAGDLLGVNKNTVSKWCREGKFPNATQDGYNQPWQIPMTDIVELMNKRSIMKQ